MKQSIYFQRAESITIFIVSLYFYWQFDFSLLAFALVLFVFDVFMIGYLFNNKAGAYVYNLGHSLMLPPLILVAGYATNTRALIGFGLIWLAHIGLDRGLGYGLKLTSGFKNTHLGHIGKAK